MFNETDKQVEEVVKCHNELLKTIVPREFYSILMSMEEMFQHPDKAIHIYNKNRQLYDKFGGSTRDLVNNEVFSKFFE